MSGYRHDMAGALGGGIAMVALVLVLLAAYVLVKCANMVYRVFARQRGRKVLWIMLSVVLCSVLLALFTRGDPRAIVLVGVALVAFLSTCHVLDLYYTPHFLLEGTIAEKVLSQWWQPLTPVATHTS